jgi:hypothetical protein
MLRYHYERLSQGYVEALRAATESGEIAEVDAEVAAYALMGIGEMIGMRWILWGDGQPPPSRVFDELERLLRGALGGGALGGA